MDGATLSIPDVVRDKLISMDGEIRQLKKDLDREKGLTKMNQDEILELEEDNRTLRTQLTGASTSNAEANALKDHVQRLKNENQSLLLEMENANSLNQQQRLELQVARKEIEVLQLPSSDPAESSGEISITERELELMESNRQLRNELMDLKADFTSQIGANNLLKEQIVEQIETIENLEGNFAEMKRLLRESKDQIKDLELELQDARTVELAKSGNSVFAEFDDMRRKNERDLKNIFCENKALRRQIVTLNTEVEELRLLGGRAAAVEVRGRCVCEDQKFEMIKLRSEVQKNRQKYMTSVRMQETFMSGHLKRSKTASDALMKSQINTLECNYRTIMEDFESMCTENNSLKDKNVELNSKLRRSEREVQAVTQELDTMKKRLQIARDRKERDEASEDMKECDKDAVLSEILSSPVIKTQPTPTPILRTPQVPLSTPCRPTGSSFFKQPMSLASATKNELFFPNGADRIKQLSFAEHTEDLESGRRMTLTNAEKRRITRVTNKKKVEPKVTAHVSKTICVKNGVKTVVNHNTPGDKKAFAPSLLAGLRPVSGSILGQTTSVDPSNETMALFGKGEVNMPISSTCNSENMRITLTAEDPSNATCNEEFNMDFSSIDISHPSDRNALSTVSMNARSSAPVNEDFFTSFNKERLLASHFSEDEEEEENQV